MRRVAKFILYSAISVSFIGCQTSTENKASKQDKLPVSLSEYVYQGQPINTLPVVEVNLDINHEVGGIGEFDRRKYINVHAGMDEPDWWGNNPQSRGKPNESADLIHEFLDGYDVYLGRNTGGISGALRWRAKEDANRPGFVDADHLKQTGDKFKRDFTFNKSDKAKDTRSIEHRGTDMIIAAQLHPFWPDGKKTSQGWSFSQTDTAAEPLGTATGHYMAEYLTHFYKQDAAEPYGKAKPKFIEIINEPLFELTDFPKGKPVDPQKVFHFHNSVAKQIKAQHSDVLVGGYTAAFPDFDKKNFKRWEERHKAFIDIAGENMDFISLHLYDFPAHNKRQKYRKGSNVEATFDMLEQYTQMKLGAVKPIVISEFGSQVHTMRGQPWQPARDWQKVNSTNALYMTFLDKPDRILKTMPFIILKGEWGRQAFPYQTRLLRQKFEGEGETGDEWVYTGLVTVYQLWSDVKGKRVDSKSSDLDLVVDSYVEGKTAYVIVNNLDFAAQDFQLAKLKLAGNPIQKVQIKHSFADAKQVPVLSDNHYAHLPDALTINAEATMVVKIDYQNPINVDQKLIESKYYSDTYKQAIVANKTLNFKLEGVKLADNAEAVLRLGIGRAHNKQLLPTLMVNGTQVTISADVRGDEQFLQGKGRPTFFGVVEVPVPAELIKENNEVTLTYPDSGGFITTVTLQYFAATRPLDRVL
ncbi:agarase [Algibacillus agarilyticus]|uniref:agarase n=1 Tax=Algibacillus agarilyticus TaxID=2234133 RepID=UPI000DD08D4A|nr:agarase [Algibacillus agarilyticus]